MSGAYNDPVAETGAQSDEEVDLAPKLPPEDAPKEPSQIDLWLGGQGAAQQAAQRQLEEERRAREEVERARTPTGRTMREQKAGEKQLADYQSGKKRDSEIKVGKKALKSHKGRLEEATA